VNGALESSAVTARGVAEVAPQLLRLAQSRPDQRSRLGPEIALVDEFPLRRAITLNMLRAYVRRGTRSFSQVSELLAQLAGNRAIPSCCVMCVGNRSLLEPGLRSQLRRLAEALAPAPVVILSDRAERDEVVAAFKEGARGYIPTDLESVLVIKALKMVMNGGSFVPAELFFEASPRVHNDVIRLDERDQHWPDRQLAVLQLLVHGKANKEIARSLGMVESTVKAHVGLIMQKLGASNRTQAALRAREIGASFAASLEAPISVA
jgi:DNA-binding NarL/FixJ family response regulator